MDPNSRNNKDSKDNQVDQPPLRVSDNIGLTLGSHRVTQACELHGLSGSDPAYRFNRIRGTGPNIFSRPCCCDVVHVESTIQLQLLGQLWDWLGHSGLACKRLTLVDIGEDSYRTRGGRKDQPFLLRELDHTTDLVLAEPKRYTEGPHISKMSIARNVSRPAGQRSVSHKR